MSKKYNIGKKSDMRMLQRDIEKSITDSVVKSAQKTKISVKCPNCEKEITVTPGHNICSFCGKTVDLQVDFDL